MDDVQRGLSKEIIHGYFMNGDDRGKKGECITRAFGMSFRKETCNTTIVMKSRTNSPTIFTIGAPGRTNIGFVVSKDFCTWRDKWSFVIVKLSKKVSVGQEFRINTADWRRLRVNSAWPRRQSHSEIRKLGSSNARLALKCALKVCIACSAALA